MSQKFLVSKSSSGTCLYGVFVSAPTITETAPYSGIMVVAKGSPAVIPQGQTKAFCGKISNRFADDPVPGDVIPDDIKDLAVPVMSHRLILNAEAQFSGVTVEQVIDDLVAAVNAPADRTI